MTDWMMGGVAENDGDEARTELHHGPEYPDDRPDPSDLYEGPLEISDEEHEAWVLNHEPEDSPDEEDPDPD